MELKGKILQILPLQTGISEKNNTEWRRQDIIVEPEGSGQYPRKVCVSLWGDNIPAQPFQEGEVLKMYIDIDSREFNGKWYTSIKAWKVEHLGGGAAESASAPSSFQTATPSAETESRPQSDNKSDNSHNEDDLPF